VTALQQWQAELAAWAIPDDILAAAPEPPWGFPVELFRAAIEEADTPSRDLALELLPVGGSVLDVGCGGGAASFALVPPAGRVVGVDSTPDMLTEYAAEAGRRGVEHEEIAGGWPDVAPKAGDADVVVCHHFFYNVADLPAFVDALTAAAGRRVVVEMTASHPLTAGAPLWRHFHGIERPEGPTADLALDVLREIGVPPQSRAWSRPPRDVPRDAYVRLNRRRLCLPVDAEPEVDRLMADPTTTSRDVVTIWWDVSRRGG
jgi:SAM-dependent methyltransferase